MKSTLGFLTAGVGIAALVRNIDEAEKAAAQLDAAFKNTGRTVGLTRQQLDDLATTIQRTTTVSDDLAKEAQAILLSFDRVRGEAFERTVKVAADLSARLGTDLKGAIRQVGLSLQDPIAGLTLLRRSGIAFSESQKDLIKKLLETGQAAKAQEVILAELERRFGGAAAASRNTFGGALAGLKNAFGDLFEGTTESTKGAVDGINSLSAALADPRIKDGLDTLIYGLAKVSELLIKTTANVSQLIARMKTLPGPLAGPIRAAVAVVDALTGDDDRNVRASEGYGGRRGRGGGKSDAADKADIDPVREVRTTAKALADEVPQFLRQMTEATRTETEQQIAAYNELKETLAALRSEGLITRDQQEARLAEGLDELLPEIDAEAIKKLYLPVKQQTSELGEFMKGVWQNVGRSIHSTISDALYEWKISWRGLLDVARRALSDITAAILTSGIKNAFKSVFSGGGSSGSSAAGSGFWATALGGLFGLAGGGRFDGVRKVGEDGPEIVSGTGHVRNQRQMAFAGAGANITYAPVTNVQVIEREDPDATKREIYQVMSIEMAEQQAEFIGMLQRSGVEVRG